MTSFLAVHASELHWATAIRQECSSTQDFIDRVAGQLYDRY